MGLEKTMAPLQYFKIRSLAFLKTVFLIAIAGSVQAEQEEDYLDLSFEELLEIPYVKIASGSLVSIEKAPSVASVITAKDIENMGARDLDEVLETVPGLYVAYTFSNYNPIYVFRGIYTITNPQAQFLINGIPITSSYRGDRGGIWGGMPVKAISRIEIIRGPGSAIYGADAYAGVINIITKSAEDITENEAGIQAGSFDTYDAWSITSHKVNGFDIAFTAEAFSSGSHDNIIEADRQTFIDTFFGTTASLAPGAPQLGRRGGDFRLDMKKENLNIHLGYQNRRGVEHAAGFGEALPPSGSYQSDRVNADVTYFDTETYEHWELSGTLSYLHINQQAENNTYILPPNSSLFGLAPLPDGLIGNPEVWENNYRLDFHAFYTGWNQHRFRIGVGYLLGDIYKVRETKNFDLSFFPLPAVTDFSDTDQTFLPEVDRENVYISLQDEWKVNEKLHLTFGARVDHYSVFGSSFNPRAALVWNGSEKSTSKVLYGKAFRAPSINELYSINPVATGNLSLEPETIDTWELSQSYKFGQNLFLGLNLFYYETDDMISYVESGSLKIAENSGRIIGYGSEFEFQYKLNKKWDFIGNYSRAITEDKAEQQDAGNAPKNQIYFRTQWQPQEDLFANVQLNWIDKRIRRRVDGSIFDSRPDTSGYTDISLILKKKNLWEKVDGALTIKNLTDTEILHPSSQNIPGDLPMAGRSVLLGLSTRF